MAKKNKNEANGLLMAMAVDNFSIPGDEKFPLGGLVAAPSNKADADTCRSFLSQFRQELGCRLLEKVYVTPGEPDKWWMCFQKRKFLNMEL